MLELTRYAKRVESHRVILAVSFGIVALLAMGFLVYSLFMPSRLLFVPPLVMTVGFVCYALWVSTPFHPRPKNLSAPEKHVTGEWRAGLFLREFPETVMRNPKLAESVTTADGKITFAEDGTIVWRPMGLFRNSRRYPDVSERRWQPPYRLWARRRRGPLNEVHVVIQTGPDQAHMKDLWLYSAKDFPV